jgi:hypothetical protein
MRRIATFLCVGALATLLVPGVATAFGPAGGFGGSGSAAGKLSRPLGVAATSATVYVADSSNHRVEYFNPDGSSPAVLSPISGTITPQDVASGGPLAGVYAASPNRLDGWTGGADLCNASESGGAYGVAVDGGGMVYVSDPAAGAIHKYLAATPLCVPQGDLPVHLAGPEGLTFAGGSLYVAEPGSGVIVKVDPASGAVQGTWTMPTYTIVANGQTITGRIEPHDVAVDGSGRVFAPDANPHANLVAVFGPDGGLQQVFGSPDSDPGNPCALSAPRGVASFGSRLYVASTGEDLIRVFDAAAAPCPAVNFGSGGGIHPAGSGQDRKRPKVKFKGLPKKCARRNFTLRIRATDDVELRRFILLVNHRRVANQAVNQRVWRVRVNFPVRKIRTQLPRGSFIRVPIEARVKDAAGKKARARRSFRICG